VSTLLGLLTETPVGPAQPRGASVRETQVREHSQRTAVDRATRLHEEQIQTLTQQLFFRHESGSVRHVGFAAVEPSTATATLCLEVAQALAAEDRRDVGLIDANPSGILLQSQLQIPSPNRAEANWPMAPRLWMVPRESWLVDASGRRITEQDLSRLRELTAEFDFSILWCAPVSWLTASIGRSCDGLVLVLTANKTRRLVAAQIKDQLRKAKVPLLGTVLAERRFPVPQGLYRSL
jgi:Mrp family chromosome partitioning ATPase